MRFFYFFLFSVDGTFTERLGKYINHSSKKANVVAKLVCHNQEKLIGLFALRDIKKGTELRYHYGISGEDWMKVS